MGKNQEPTAETEAKPEAAEAKTEETNTATGAGNDPVATAQPQMGGGDPVTQQIDTIREIIFGQNIREYQSEFSEIRDMLQKEADAIREEAAASKNELQTLIRETEQALRDQIASLTQDTQDKIDQLNEAKTDRRKLGQLLIEIGEEISRETQEQGT